MPGPWAIRPGSDLNHPVRILFLLLLFCCTACTTLPTPQERHRTADALVQYANWEPLALETTPFWLLAYVPQRFATSEQLTVYIEGDGLAWITPSLPSDDPTPNNPVALRLALNHPDGNAAYLARPCQYGGAAQLPCKQDDWTSARFAPEVVAASDQAIDQLKARFGAERLTLVGYSGGGAVAALVAARRTDVERLITVAGNLDHAAWTQTLRLRPLSGSLNPADEIQRLAPVRQWHFVGGKDRVITPELVQGYADRFPAGSQPVVRIEPDFDHHCCWVEHWARLYSQTR